MGVSAGRVLLIPKGDWNAETTYTGLDWVRHNGATWVCKNTCTNIEPTGANSDNWQMMSRDGNDAIFTYKTKAEYDAAVENNEIPDGAKVIKEYDEEGQLYITDVDTAMSDTSTNPVQNRVIKKYIDELVARAIQHNT